MVRGLLTITSRGFEQNLTIPPPPPPPLAPVQDGGYWPGSGCVRRGSSPADQQLSCLGSDVMAVQYIFPVLVSVIHFMKCRNVAKNNMI